MIDYADDRIWWRFALCFAGLSLGLIVMLYGFVLILDPFGIRTSPNRPPTPIMDVNQRFMYPQLIRSGRYDSAVFGTSTVRLLDPKRLEDAFGGRFANLGMNAATPWEQVQLIDLFLRTVPEPKSLILGLDRTWCEDDADRKKTTFRTFPAWLYDDSAFNDYPKLLNMTALEIAGKVLLNRFGLMSERIPANGFEIFVPDDALYDPARARFHLSQWPLYTLPPGLSYRMNPRKQRAVVFPALPWLAEILDRIPKTTSVTLVFPPSHIRAQPIPGTRDAALDLACKTQVTDLARAHGAAVTDFRLRSAVTSDDTNFWDPLHYRIGIAQRIVEDLKAARVASSDAPDGFYKVLNPLRP